MTNEELKEWRKHLELTQPQMAKYLGVTVSTYRKWEQGQYQWAASTQALIDLLQELEKKEAVPCYEIVYDRLTRAVYD